MRYLEIQDGITISIDCIEAIEKKDEVTSKVYTHHRVYLATFPYSTLLEMIKQEDIVDKKLSSTQITEKAMGKLDKVLNQAQHFVG